MYFIVEDLKAVVRLVINILTLTLLKVQTNEGDTRETKTSI